MIEEKIKYKIAPIVWESKDVDPSLIDPTPVNYKIKTELGLKRLQASLGLYGLANSLTVNPYVYKDAKLYGIKVKPFKGVRYLLVDGNSRLEEAKRFKVKKISISYPTKPLSPKKFKEMSAMFDFAKAGEVDVDRIKGDLGHTREFYETFHMEIPLPLLAKLGKQPHMDIEYPGKKNGDRTSAVSDVPISNIRQVALIFSVAQEEEFRKWVPILNKMFKTDNVTDMVYKALKSIIKNR